MHQSKTDDFRLLLEGAITSEEYVRRLDQRIRERRFGYRWFEVDSTPRPWSGRTPKQASRLGFWAGVRSVLAPWWR